MAKATEMTEGEVMDKFFAENETLRSDYVPEKTVDEPGQQSLQDGDSKDDEAKDAAEPGTGEATGAASKPAAKSGTSRTSAAAKKPAE